MLTLETLLHLLITAIWSDTKQRRANDTLREQLAAAVEMLTPAQKQRLTDRQRRRIARAAMELRAFGLQDVTDNLLLVTWGTVRRWARELLDANGKAIKRDTPARGRPAIPQPIIDFILTAARANHDAGCPEIRDMLLNNYPEDEVPCIATIHKYLTRAGIRRPKHRRISLRAWWTNFLNLNFDTVAVCDLFTVTTKGLTGTTTWHVLLVMKLATREISIAGITKHPNTAFMRDAVRLPVDAITAAAVHLRTSSSITITAVITKAMASMAGCCDPMRPRSASTVTSLAEPTATGCSRTIIAWRRDCGFI